MLKDKEDPSKSIMSINVLSLCKVEYETEYIVSLRASDAACQILKQLQQAQWHNDKEKPFQMERNVQTGFPRSQNTQMQCNLYT